jgi:hypothetical protein
MTPDIQPDPHPIRVQLSRKKGWRKPPNTVNVARPSPWGNRFVIGEVQDGILTIDRDHAVSRFRESLTPFDGTRSGFLRGAVDPEEVRRQLRGKNLACWCPAGQPCHADVLLELANGK